VQHALSVGFTLDELSRLLKIREKGGAPCKEVRALAAAKLKDLDEQLQSLSVLRNELCKMLGRWDLKLARTKKGEQAGLLDMLAASAPGLEKAPLRERLGRRGIKTSRLAITHARSRSR
jgi:DNA-binding transcriptional MerR regulator